MSLYAPIGSSTDLPRPSNDSTRRGIRLDTSPPSSPQIAQRLRGNADMADSDSDDESDIVYRDALDIEPFDEKRAGLSEERGVDNRWEDEGEMEDGFEGYAEPRRLRPRKRSKRVLATLLGIIVGAAVIGALAGSFYPAPSYAVVKGTKHVTMDHIFNGTFSPKVKTLAWVKEAPDGTFSRLDDDHNIILSTVSSMNASRLLVNASSVLNEEGEQLSWREQDWRLSADGLFVLFRADSSQLWRHSTRANYYIHRLSDSSTYPLTTPSRIPRTAIAVWSPTGHSIAYVLENDVYLVDSRDVERGRPDRAALRITTDGSETVFNGIPDWVYEEEVLEGDTALWWSPDGDTFAFLRSDETDVKNYRIPIYNPTNDAGSINPYPYELDMKYPKPGTPNPLVTVHTFHLPTYRSTNSVSLAKSQLSWPEELNPAERIIIEVGWVGDDALIVKEIDRAARKGKVVVFVERATEGKVTRVLGKEGEEGDDGWIDHGQDVIPVRSPMKGYLDIVPNEGYNHIAFFSPVDAKEPIWITKGTWGEVTQIAGIDEELGIVYFVAAAPSIDRHLYAAYLPTELYTPAPLDEAPTFDPAWSALTILPSDMLDEDNDEDASASRKTVALTDTSSPGFHDISLSPGGGYYVLQYRGPDVPWQKVIDAKAEPGDGERVQLLEGNEGLNKTLNEYAAPRITRTTLKSDDYELNMLEMLPLNIDTSGRKKYPVLIRVYGGPGSQMVSNQFARDWHSYLVTEKKYIVIMIDGRGTGFAGRHLRNTVMDDLGHWEVVDQVAAAREMAKRVYVDNKRIGIWGWSYGGYMTCKTIEADSGIFTLGMAVAPVTNWLYYDSVYTERYMSTPISNEGGYKQSAVNNVTSFGKVDFLLAHGSGDDNVHFANSARLVDKLTEEEVRGWRFRMFTDSNHSMNKRHGYREVYEWMTAYLDEKWGRGGTIRHS